MQGASQEGSQLLRMETELSSWDAASKISGMAPDILPSSARKIEEAKVHLSLQSCVMMSCSWGDSF